MIKYAGGFASGAYRRAVRLKRVAGDRYSAYNVPEFEMEYKVDPLKQHIADSWPDCMDDSCARSEWGWQPQYDLEAMTVDMLEKLRLKLDK